MNKYLLLGALLIFAGIVYTQLNTSPEQTTSIQQQIESPDTSQENDMSFFVTSKNSGAGADFGGVTGADAYCQQLAESAGSNLTWAAYLSADATNDSDVINARDRIGPGPWYNAAGELVATSVESLHSNNSFSKTLALDENGDIVNGRGDSPNQHDILTGSDMDGMLAVGDGDTTCQNWTSSDEGSAFVGHHDRVGLDASAEATSWNASHGSRGCSLENLQGTGGEGLLYCFATE
jgi:hypothetical protein